MTALIFTATGKVGSACARDMIARGEKPRLYVRDPAKAKDMFPDGDYETAEGTLEDETAIRQTMNGIDAVFFAGLDSMGADLSYADHILNGAKDAGVERVVFLSAFKADASSDSAFVKMMGVLEDKVRASGIDYTILGGEWFMDNFFGYIAGGELAMPFGDGRNSFVSAADIGACAAEALRNPAHANKAYIVTGPQTLHHDDVTRIVGEAVGKPCTYRALSVDEFREKTAAIGWEAWMTELYIDITSFMRDGDVGPTSGDVEAILGRAPTSLHDFALQHKDQFVELCEPA